MERITHTTTKQTKENGNKTMARIPKHKEVLEYIQMQYLACKQEWLDWSQDSETQTDATIKAMSRKFANEAYAQAKILEIMARDLYDVNLFDWYLDLM